jgi:PucR family transcriptional regulator, purine catabolism regulatory protein
VTASAVPEPAAAHDLDALHAVTDAVAAGAGLPEVVRAAGRALDASLVLLDHTSAVLAVAARSTADERSLMADAPGVETHELRVGGDIVGRLRMRLRSGTAPAPFMTMILTLIASEVERLRAPERQSEVAQQTFLRALIERSITDRGDILARASELGLDLSAGGAVIVVRAHHFAVTEIDWRGRVLAVCDRATRATAPGALLAVLDHPASAATGMVVLLVPAEGADAARRCAAMVARELQAALGGFTFAVGHSRAASDPADLYRAGQEALLAANVAEAAPGGDPEEPAAVLAFEDTGAYRLLLPAMSEDPGELHRFYDETIAPLVAYDEQYETDLVTTLETFLDCDGNVANTAGRLYTHRHTVRYRLVRVHELTGHDVASTDGRERLGLGLKAMRVLGIAAPGGPARERGAGGGRVPREPRDR